jgi:hypothetical protein
MMNIKVTSISVGDQEQALRLSTDTPSPGEESGRHAGSVPLAHRRLTRGTGRH